MPSPNYESLDSLIISKRALQLVYDFHALRHPGTHPVSLLVESPPELGEYYDKEFLAESSEYVLETDMPVRKKAEIVTDRFVPVMKAIMTSQPPDVISAFVSYCADQTGPDEVALMADKTGIVRVEDILPRAKALRSMQRDLVVRGFTHSRALERFIRSHST